jgi:hypothetical protein
MKVETKFNVGSTIWYMSNNRPCSRVIGSIYIFSEMKDIRIRYAWDSYHPSDLKYDDYVTESGAFSSKEALLASL